MSRLMSKLFFLAVCTVILVFTFISFFNPSVGNHYKWDTARANTESLRGAIPQKSPLSPPTAYVVSQDSTSPGSGGSEEKQNLKQDEIDQKNRDDEIKKQKLEAEMKENAVKKQDKMIKQDDAKNKTEDEKKQEEENKRKAGETQKKIEEDARFRINVGSFVVPKNIYYDPVGPKPHEIIMLCASDGKGHNGGIPDILNVVASNRQEYADLHGYTYQFLNVSKYNIGEAQPVWAKLPAIVEAFNLHPKAQWVWWLDLDALIMTPTVDLREYILSPEALEKKLLRGAEYNRPGQGGTGVFSPKNQKFEDIEIIITQDQNGLNAGSFFIRRSEFTKILLSIWSDPFFVKAEWLGQEQESLFHLATEHEQVRKHVGIVQLREINAYALKNVDNWSWEKGVLAIHFAGCWVADRCVPLWNEFLGYMTPVSAVRDTYVRPKHPSEDKSSPLQ